MITITITIKDDPESGKNRTQTTLTVPPTLATETEATTAKQILAAVKEAMNRPGVVNVESREEFSGYFGRG